MTHRERIRRTFRFEPVDRPGVDLMEGHVWSDLAEYFRGRGLESADAVIELLDPDSRWIGLRYVGPPASPPPPDQPLALPARA
jgi:hypothetical protein